MRLTERARRILAGKEGRGFALELPLGEAKIDGTRNALLRWMYGKGVVESNEFSAHSADKLLFSRFIEILLPEDDFHPKTRSLRELEHPEESIPREFPQGFVAKAAGGINTDGRGIYRELAPLLGELESNPDFLGSLDEACPLTGQVSSGERFLVQECIGQKEHEYRLHTLGGRVVRGATYTRWDQEWDLSAFRRAEDALQAFLDRLPAWFVAGQAWSVDLIESDRFRMVEVNSNRGRQIHWSGDLSIPDTLKAYVLHLEEFYGARFLGEGGELFRQGRANAQKFLEKFGAEAVARHEALRGGLE